MKKLIPILLAVFALASCEKDPDMGKLDNNYLVYTNYDKQANFKDFSTFYLADKILVISDSKEPEYLEGAGAGMFGGRCRLYWAGAQRLDQKRPRDAAGGPGYLCGNRRPGQKGGYFRPGALR